MGRLPILLLTVKRWFSFAKHAFCSPNDSFLKKSLISNNPAADELEQFSWRSRLLQTLEVSNLVAYPDVPFLSLFHSDIGTECQNRLSALYIQGWRDSIDKIGNQFTGHKLQTYSKIKDYFGMENYILLLPVAKRRHFTKLKSVPTTFLLGVGVIRGHLPPDMKDTALTAMRWWLEMSSTSCSSAQNTHGKGVKCSNNYPKFVT